MTFATDRSTFTPFLCNITGITNAQQAVVTFSSNHPYTIGELISFRVSKPYGMTEINNLTAKVIGSTSSTVTIDLVTANFTAFVFPPVGTVEVPAVTVPAGSGIVPNSIPPQTNLQDVFDNVPLT